MYLVTGLLWIALSDLALAASGELTDRGFLVSAGKGAAYVLLSAGLVFGLCRREFRIAARSTARIRASELRLAAAQRSARIGSWEWDVAAGTVWCSDTMYDLFGLERGVAPSMEAFAARVHPSDRAAAVTRIEAVLTGRSDEFDNDVRVVRPDGRATWVHSRGRATRDAAGTLLRLDGSDQDITARKTAEEALRASEQEYRELADAIPQIVWTAEPGGGLTHVNARAVTYSGRSADALLGQSWGGDIHPDDRPAVVAATAQAAASGVPRDFEFRLRRADGVYRWHVSRQVPARAADGTVAGWYGTYTDIDDLKRAESALRETDARLREAQRIARLGSWSWEPPTDRVSWSDAEFELFGVDPLVVAPSFA
ncbi:MAG TPA: PAS domain-containing protein, partial [Gemmata sp.]